MSRLQQQHTLSAPGDAWDTLNIGGGVVAASLLLLAITRQSLWVDEAFTAWLAGQASVRQMFALLAGLSGSDPQIPGYYMYMWCWAHVFGLSELALRFANLPFGLLLLAATAWGGTQVFGARRRWLLVSVSPFVWYYMNEARPYMAVMGLSALGTAAVLVYLWGSERSRRAATWIATFACCAAWFFHMLSVFLVPALAVVVAIAQREQRIRPRQIIADWWRPALVALPFFAALGTYYLWTVTRGAGGFKGTAGIINASVVAYEFLGLQGLGPARDVARSAGIRALMEPEYLAGVGLGLAVWTVIGGLALRRGDHKRAAMAAGLAVGMALLIGPATAVGFRYWGRHFAMLFPLFIFLIFAVIQRDGPYDSRGGHSRLAGAAVYLLAVLWLASSLRLITTAEHEKDDYRSAVAAAIGEQRRSDAVIAWAAEVRGGEYYGVELSEHVGWVNRPQEARGISVSGWPESRARDFVATTTRTHPVVLALSKADEYDGRGGWQAVIDSTSPRLIASPKAFRVFVFDQVRTPDSATDAMHPVTD